MTEIIVAAVICGAAGLGAGYFYRLKIAEGKLGSAETEAARIISAAKKDAEAQRKETILEGKEEAQRLRSEAERDYKERHSELQHQMRRLNQKEEHLDKKFDTMEKKEEALLRKEGEITKVREKIDRLHEQQLAELERISELSYDDAKELLLANVKTEIKHETAQLIKSLEDEAKEEAEQKSLEIISLAIQRCAADHVAETTVSVVSLPNDEMKGRISNNGKIQRCQTEYVDFYCRCLRLYSRRLYKFFYQSQVSFTGSGQITVNTVCPKGQNGKPRTVSQDPFNSPTVRAYSIRHRATADGNKGRTSFLGSRRHFINEAHIIALNRIDFTKSRNIYHRRRVVPTWFIMCTVRGVTTRCVMHNYKTAQFI